jgi:hypothetical protein
MNTNGSSPASLAAAHGSALLTRLYNHRAMMAPHQKERHTGKMLLECIAEIERLSEAIRLTLEENSHLADGDNCTLLRLKRAYAQNSDSPTNR